MDWRKIAKRKEPLFFLHLLGMSRVCSGGIQVWELAWVERPCGGSRGPTLSGGVSGAAQSSPRRSGVSTLSCPEDTSTSRHLYSMAGLMLTSSKRAYARGCVTVLQPEPLPLQQATADLYLRRRHSSTVLSQSLWDLWVLVCTRFV